MAQTAEHPALTCWTPPRDSYTVGRDGSIRCNGVLRAGPVREFVAAERWIREAAALPAERAAELLTEKAEWVEGQLREGRGDALTLSTVRDRLTAAALTRAEVEAA